MLKVNTIIIFLLSFSISLFAQKNSYLDEFNSNLKNLNTNKAELLKISKEELTKFEKEKDSVYLISQNLALLNYYSNPKEKVKKITIATEIVKLNNNKYPFITSLGNFTIASYFLSYSPDMCEKFINEALDGELKTKNKELLPQLYHLKGLIYFNKNELDKSFYYFNKCLKVLRYNDYLLKASMYNNFGLIYEKKKKFGIAINQFNKAINILNNKANITREDSIFRILLYRNLAEAYYKNQEVKVSQNILETVFLQYKNNENHLWDVVRVARQLYDIYVENNENEKIKTLILFLKKHELNNNDKNMNIYLTEMLLDNSLKNKDIDSIKKYTEKLISLKNEIIIDNESFIRQTNDILTKNIIENTNEKYQNQISNQNKKTKFISIIALLSIIVLISIFFFFKSKIKLINNQKRIYEQSKIILEKNIELHGEKIKNLHLSLNIKKETEKAFFEKIKKIRNSSKNNTEEVLKELYLDLNNRILIDKNNFDYSEESYTEKINFMERISKKYPTLSNQELNLCTYFVLDLAIKEVAILEGLSAGSISVYKTKIKTKMNLGKEIKLNEFLRAI